jgi:hypothetical protein
MENKDGIFQCARFAFKPNQLQYCGPDQNKELKEYLEKLEADGGLAQILKKFECMVPNLQFIASENKITNPFDEKVVEAYWIGNDLLANTRKPQLYSYLRENTKLMLKDKIRLGEKMEMPANMHHSFHVFKVWQQAEFAENPQILKMMDECRIGWGQVLGASKGNIKVLYEPIIFQNQKLGFGEAIQKDIVCETKNPYPKTNDWISFHWSSYCKTLSPDELQNLRKWTKINMNIRNTKK